MVIETEGSDAPDLTLSNPIAALDQIASSKPLSEAAQHGTPPPIAPPRIGGQVLQPNGQSTPPEAQELPAKTAGADLSLLDPALAVAADGTATDQPSTSGQDAAKENHSQQEERASSKDAQMTAADVPIQAVTPSVPSEDAQGQPANRSPVEGKVAETIPSPTSTPSNAQDGEPTKVQPRLLNDFPDLSNVQILGVPALAPSPTTAEALQESGLSSRLIVSD